MRGYYCIEFKPTLTVITINQALVVIYSHFAGIELIYHLRASEFKLTWITSNYCIIHIVNM